MKSVKLAIIFQICLLTFSTFAEEIQESKDKNLFTITEFAKNNFNIVENNDFLTVHPDTIRISNSGDLYIHAKRLYNQRDRSANPGDKIYCSQDGGKTFDQSLATSWISEYEIGADDRIYITNSTGKLTVADDMKPEVVFDYDSEKLETQSTQIQFDSKGTMYVGMRDNLFVIKSSDSSVEKYSYIYDREKQTLSRIETAEVSLKNSHSRVNFVKLDANGNIYMSYSVSSGADRFSGLFQSTDDGKTFKKIINHSNVIRLPGEKKQKVEQFSPDQLQIDKNNHVYVSGIFGNDYVLVVSRDQGRSFHEILNLAHPIHFNLDASGLLYAYPVRHNISTGPLADNYNGNKRGIYLSKNGGENFDHLLEVDVFGAVVDNEKVFVNSPLYGLVMIDTKNLKVSSTLKGHIIKKLARDDQGIIYAAYGNKVVEVSNDHGQTFHPIFENLIVDRFESVDGKMVIIGQDFNLKGTKLLVLTPKNSVQ